MNKLKTIITTDGEIDDMNSLLHLCLYLNEIDLKGIVYTASQYHFNGDGEHTLGEVTPHYRTSGMVGLERPRKKFGPDPDGKNLKSFRPFPMGWIENIWKGSYAEAYPFLRQNAEGYPSPEELLSITKVGNIEFEGDIRFDTEGSDLIKASLLSPDDEPVYLQSWGGANTIVRALLSTYEQYGRNDDWQLVSRRIARKTKVLGINQGVGQDNSWLDAKIPEIYPGLETLWPENIYGTYQLMGPGQPDIEEQFKASWFLKYIHNGKSALMNEYHLMGDGVRIEGEAEVYQFGLNATLDFGFPNVPAMHFNQYDFIGEGDSNTYIPLLSFGLRGNEDVLYPGLLGRMFANDEKGGLPYHPQTGKVESYNPFIRAYQNDWAARARWCYQTASEANHAPIVEISETDIMAKAGKTVEVSAVVSDPDYDEVSICWEVFPLYNKYSGVADNLRVWEVAHASTHFTVPADAASGDFFVLIIRAEDHNETPMTSFGTVVVHVE